MWSDPGGGAMWVSDLRSLRVPHPCRTFCRTGGGLCLFGPLKMNKLAPEPHFPTAGLALARADRRSHFTNGILDRLVHNVHRIEMRGE